MKKTFFLSILFIIMCPLKAQTDTLGSNPHLFYYNMPRLGDHDSMTCSIKVESNRLAASSLDEIAFYMHSDTTLHVIGIAFYSKFCTQHTPGPSDLEPQIDTNRITVYDSSMKLLERIYVDNFRPDTLDSNYLRVFIPNIINEPGTDSFYAVKNLRLAFFNGDTVDVCGDFYLGFCQEPIYQPGGSIGRHPGRLAIISENHPAPYIFPTRPLRGLPIDSTEWQDLDISFYGFSHRIPLIFPILASYNSSNGSTAIGHLTAADRHVALSPNPATGRVQVTAECGMTEVSVYNAAGEQVYRQPASGHSATVDTGRWPSGVYVVHIETPLGQAVKKLVVN